MIPIIIILFIIGTMLLLGSFLFRSAFFNEKDKTDSEVYLEEMLNKRLDEVALRLDDVAEESAGFIKKQTEKELEKLSSQKITEVNEYSDQVMEQINKNHHEVMFLYGLLSDKQKELDETVESLNQAQLELRRHSFEMNHQGGQRKEKEEEVPQFQEASSWEAGQLAKASDADSPKGYYTVKEIPNGNYDRRSKILNLAREGKSDLDIARLLSMGVGEVRLVLELSREGEESL